jgi:S1-C subfamily serine protease
MQRLIDFLLIGAIILATAILVSVNSNADTAKAMTLLRRTTIRVDGLGCTGSGSIVEGKSGHHYVVTNSHVCNCVRYRGAVRGTFESGELVTGHSPKLDWSADLCAAQVEDSRPALKLGQQLSPMTQVSTRGYPGGRLTESHGMIAGHQEWDSDFPISELGRCPHDSLVLYGMNGNIEGCRMHFTSTLSDLFGRPGSSGSPVVNDDGELVGVISSWMPGSSFETGQVPFEQLKRFLEAL